MTAAPGLDSPGTYAVLVGTGRHAPGSELPELPSVDTTLDALERVLVEVCGMAADRVHRVPGDAGPPDVVAAVERAAAEATGAVLLYYVGHGLLGPRDELYLATRTSRSADSVAGAVPYRTLRDLLGESAGGGVVVLDCCFSGRAAAPGSDRPREPYASARPEGSFLLGSASHFALSFAPEGAPYTLFSGRLLSLLETGDPSGPPLLTMDHLYAALERGFRGEPVSPRRQSEGSLGQLAVARNRVYRPATGPGAVPPADVPCPYPGMEAFRTEDSGHFFGREELTARLLEAVCAPAGRPPVVLVGASGAGKSSLLRAGLLAGLERRHEAGPDGGVPWPALLLAAPGARPMRALAALWARATGRSVDGTLTALDAGRFPEPLPGRRPCRLLVVDQFEEVFTRCRDLEEATRFVTLLTGEGPGPRVVLGLRADHYGSALTHPALARALEHGQLAVPPMDDGALRSAIEAPARSAGLTLEDGLTARLLHDLRQGHDAATPGPGAALPFLAHALRETWLRRSGAELTLTGYQATGGIWRSVTTTTEQLYQSLREPGRDVLRELLLRLVHLTADGTEPVVRRRTGPDALLDGFASREREEAAALLEKLAETRLLTVDRDEARISHEALLRAWPRLRRWIDEDRVNLLGRQQLEEAAEAWEAAGRDPAYLYRGARLENAGTLSGTEPGSRVRPLRGLAQEFLDAGRAAAGAERDRERRRTRGLQQALAATAFGMCLALLAGGLAYHQRGVAMEQRELATNEALLAAAQSLRETRPDAALRLGLTAHGARPSPETRGQVFDTLRHSRLLGSTHTPRPARGTVAVLSPDGTTRAAREGAKAGLVLRDVSGAAERSGPVDLTGCPDVGGGLAFSSDGRTLAAYCGHATIRVWKLGASMAPQRVQTVRADHGPGELALDRTGSKLAVESGTRVVLWDMTGGQGPERLNWPIDQRISTMAFSPNGRLLLATTRSSTAEGGGSLWDLSDPRRMREPARLETGDGPVAFSPDSRTFMTSRGGILESWDVSDPVAPRGRSHQPPADPQHIHSIAISHDGKTVATSGSDNSVVIRSGSTLVQTAALTHHAGAVTSLAFAPDDTTFVSADQTLTARWRTAADAASAQSVDIFDHNGIRSLAYSPSGKLMVTGASDGSVTVRDAMGRRTAGPWKEHKNDVWALAFSHDGRTLATGDGEGFIVLWHVREDGTLRKAGAPFRRGSLVTRLSFAPDAPILWGFGGEWGSAYGDRLNSRSWTAAWDLRSSDRPRPLPTGATGGASFSSDGQLALVGHYLVDGHTAEVRSQLLDELPVSFRTLALHPSGGMLAAGDWRTDKRMQLWDVSDLAAPRRLGVTEADGDASVSRELVFHPGGSLLAEISTGGVVTLYDVSLPDHPRRLGVLSKLAFDIEFSPDGDHVATIGADGNAIVWDVGHLAKISADPISMACEIAGGTLTDAERERYAPDMPEQSTCN